MESGHCVSTIGIGPFVLPPVTRIACPSARTVVRPAAKIGRSQQVPPGRRLHSVRDPRAGLRLRRQPSQLLANTRTLPPMCHWRLWCHGKYVSPGAHCWFKGAPTKARRSRDRRSSRNRRDGGRPPWRIGSIVGAVGWDARSPDRIPDPEPPHLRRFTRRARPLGWYDDGGGFRLF